MAPVSRVFNAAIIVLMISPATVPALGAGAEYPNCSFTGEVSDFSGFSSSVQTGSDQSAIQAYSVSSGIAGLASCGLFNAQIASGGHYTAWTNINIEENGLGVSGMAFMRDADVGLLGIGFGHSDAWQSASSLFGTSRSSSFSKAATVAGQYFPSDWASFAVSAELGRGYQRTHSRFFTSHATSEFWQSSASAKFYLGSNFALAVGGGVSGTTSDMPGLFDQHAQSQDVNFSCRSLAPALARDSFWRSER